MDPAQQSTQSAPTNDEEKPVNPTTPTETTTSTPQPSNPKKPLPKKMLLIAGGAILLIVIILGILFASVNSKPTQQSKDTTNNESTKEGLADVKKNNQSSETAKANTHLLVYGAWTGQTSVIKAVDISNSNNYLLATLPLEIKKVSVLNDSTLLYIDQVDTKDHGKRITLYNMKEKAVNTSINAADGYVIDDYVISPDKKYISIWEVSMSPDTKVLQGGKSRVYAIDLTRPTIKNLLFDENVTLTTPIHYPRAILNNGTVLTDTFLPNDPKGGAGWAYGMSTVDFDGTNRKDIETMTDGTYGSQPTLSPDGKYLLFAGYDGSKGDGKAVVKGYRQALLTPNTVELLNTQTLQRFKLPNLPNGNTYSQVSWDHISGNVIITVLSSDADDTGVFVYDLAAQAMTKLAIPDNDATPYGYVSQLPDNKTLIATSDDKPSNLGNLGEIYAYAFTQLSVLDTKNTITNLRVQDPFIQYITILPGNYFKNVLGAKTVLAATNPQPTIIDLYSDKNNTKENLQLYTFFLKAALEPTRLSQQTSPIAVTGMPNNGDVPTCRQLAESQCQAQGMTTGTEAYNDCVKTNKNQNKVTAKLAGQCSDSPLYLYGPSGQKVRVAIHTPIYNTQPSSTGEYDITLGNNGSMNINGKVVSSITYDYESNLSRLQPPSKGTIVNKENVVIVLKTYATKLGLNDKETTDLLKAAKAKIISPYAYISFFDQETSKSILPISFYPQPDNYHNVVFYFKLLDKKPEWTPESPIFPAPFQRNGFTAVEISEIVE